MIAAYRAQIDWLLTQAEEFENGHRYIAGRVAGKEVDVAESRQAPQLTVKLHQCRRKALLQFEPWRGLRGFRAGGRVPA